MKKLVFVIIPLFILFYACGSQDVRRVESATTAKDSTGSSKTAVEKPAEPASVSKKTLPAPDRSAKKEKDGGEESYAASLLSKKDKGSLDDVFKDDMKEKSPELEAKGPSSGQGYSAPQAGEHDDNEEFQYFLKFLTDNASGSGWESMNIKDRRLIEVTDENGLPLFQAKVSWKGKSYSTYGDGEIILPGDSSRTSMLSLNYGTVQTNVAVSNTSLQRQVIKLSTKRNDLQSIPLDIVFLIDTTGSMGDEIDILRDTIYSIYTRIKKLPANNLTIRLGMVLYRDQGDDYVTKEFPLTENISDFQKTLFEQVEASGGGDTPEDMLSGLSKTVGEINWNENAIKLVFLITDAPAHLNNLKEMEGTIRKAGDKNIKIFSIGASGLDLTGETHLRVLSQQTKGKFIFLTYGEKGESSGTGTPDDPGKVSHHTGANYVSRNLDDIVVDNVKLEIYNQLPVKELAAFQKDYNYKSDEDKIFRRVDNALQQIKKQISADSKLTGSSTVLVLPPDADDKALNSLAKHVNSLSEDIITKEKMLKVVDRSKLKILLEELKLKLAGFTESDKIKQLTGADTILAGKLYFVGSSTVLFIRLIDAGTSEVLAASMVKM